MPISLTEQVRSAQFVKHLELLCGLIDEWSQLIPEGEYLKGMDTLKELFEMGEYSHPEVGDETFRPAIMRNTIVREHIARTNLRVMVEKRNLTDAQKLASGGYKCCKKCDRIISLQYEKDHLKTAVCWKIYRSKHLTQNIGDRDTSRYEAVITRINGALMETSNFRREKWGMCPNFC
tara:strand:+ start:1923 stop:2453 length:531 start_codon:yes stop_codon:yes gene_type:complete